MAKQENKFDMKRIAGTLKYGRFDGASRKKFLIVYIIFTVLSIGLGFGLGLTLVILDIQEQGYNGVTHLGEILCCTVVVLILPTLFGFLIFCNERHRGEIEKWVNSSVELIAYSRELDALKDYLGIKYSYKIRIEFEYEGKHYKYESAGKQIGGTDFSVGYHSVWKDYLNKQVKILYSPKYEQVIVPKNRVTAE